MTHIDGDKLVRCARALIGTPFRHAGRTVMGVDCVGLLVLSARAAGLQVDDVTAYSPVVDGDFMSSSLARACEPIPFPAAVPGDVLLFRVGGSPQHVALVTESDGGPTMMVHAYQTVGRVVEHAIDDKWVRRLAGAYRLRGAPWEA